MIQLIAQCFFLVVKVGFNGINGINSSNGSNGIANIQNILCSYRTGEMSVTCSHSDRQSIKVRLHWCGWAASAYSPTIKYKSLPCGAELLVFLSLSPAHRFHDISKPEDYTCAMSCGMCGILLWWQRLFEVKGKIWQAVEAQWSGKDLEFGYL